MIVLVFEGTAERVKVADALDVLEARDADTVGDVDEVFEEDADIVYGVFEGCAVILMGLGLGAGVAVVGENVAVELMVVLGDRNPDMLIEFVGLVVEVLDNTEYVELPEIRPDAELLPVTVDVLEGGCVFVGVVLELGVFDTLAVTVPVNVLRAVDELRPLELIVFELLTLLVDVVVEEGVLVDKEHLDAVDELLVVLEVVPVAVLVEVLRLVGEPFGLADIVDDPVDVLEGPIELVIVGDPEPDFDDSGDLDIVGEPVLVFEVLTLPVDVFVIGGVFDNLAEEVEVRVGAIVCVAAGDVEDVFEPAAVCVFRNVGYIVAVAAAVAVCRRLG